MNIFLTIQRTFRMMGIDLMQSIPSKYPFNVQNLRCIFVYGSGAVASFYYTIYYVNTFEEYIASFYVLSSMLICLTLYSFIVWKMDNLIEFYTFLKNTIQDRECISCEYIRCELILNH